MTKQEAVLHEVSTRPHLQQGDYAADGLSVVVLDDLFPNMIVGDKAGHPWPYLRREVPHNWYCDRRHPEVGFLDRDEVLLLYNLALQFQGRPGLEIGCWMGWSTCHLALAGVQLDVIDPVLANPEHEASVRHALERGRLIDRVRLLHGSSPEAIEQLAAAGSAKWNLFFIDGNHEAPGPEEDARACLRHAADDALFVFHDLVSPDVEKGLAVLAEAGFKTMLYETMQIVGIAWRGNVSPVGHVPDPACDWSLPTHLLKYAVAGESPGLRAERMAGLLRAAEHDRVQAAQAAIEAGQDLARKEAIIQEVTRGAAQFERLAGERAEELARLAAERDREFAAFRAQIEDRDRSLAELRGKLAEAGAALNRAGLTLRQYEERSTAANLRLEEQSRAMAQAMAEAAALQARLARIKRSYSWAMSAPLREMRRAASRAVRYCRNFAARFKPQARPEFLRLGGLANVVKRYRLLRHSPLMNRSYYVRSYPDAVRSPLGRFWHYATVGASQLRRPSALFDPVWYLEQNPDVAAAGYDPVLHYLEIGWKQRRNPHPLFDVDYYLNSNPDVEQAGLEPLSHYINKGARQGRNPSRMFDSAWYLAQHADVADSMANPLEHYVTVGAVRQFEPHPLFDTHFYLQRKPDLAVSPIGPLADYLANGPGETYNPEPVSGELPDRGVCIVTPDFVGPISNGGIGTACYEYALELARSGRQVTVLLSEHISRGQTNHWRRHYAKAGIAFLSMADLPPVRHFTYGNSWFLERSQRLLDFLAPRSFDFIHFQDWKANGFWPIRAKRLGCALQNSVLTVMMHSSTRWIAQGMEEFPADAAMQAGLLYCEAYCMRHCDLVVSPSRHMFEWAERNSIQLASNRMLVPYVSGDGIAADDGGAVELDVDHLIFFGRLETRKGLHVFAEALRLLKQHHPQRLPRKVSFLGKHATVNGLPSARFIEQLAADLPEIEFAVLAALDRFQALAYLERSRGLVVMPSLLDNCPLSVIECIEHRLPFLAAATGGIPEMADDRVLFVPTADELAKRLVERESLEYATLAHKYSAANARERWLNLHDSDPSRRIEAGGDSSPQVSVCIPFYNHGAYFERLVRAFTEQTYARFEVIVVDDGSSGDSAIEFERVAHECADARFRFVRSGNQGPGAARNRMAAMSAGEYLLFFDADNLPKGRDFIARLAIAAKASGADCITVPYDLVDHECMAPGEQYVMGSYRPMGGCVEAGFFENVFGDTTMIVRRSVFEALGGFSVERDSWEDHQFLLNLCLKGYALEVYPESLFYYRASKNGRYLSSNHYRNFENLMAQLGQASQPTLFNIVKQVALPTILQARR